MANLMGYIKLYRSLLESPIFDNEKLLKVFIWCLLKASHKGYTAIIGTQTVELMPGQFVYGGRKAAAELGIPYTTLRRYMATLEELHTIGIKVAQKWSVVTVENWALYQLDNENMAQKRRNNGTKTDTYNNDKNVKNNRGRAQTPIEPPNYRAIKPVEIPLRGEPMPNYMKEKYSRRNNTT